MNRTYDEHFAEFYDKMWAGTVRGIGRQLAALYAQNPLEKRNNLILDVGCGTGRVTKILLEDDFEVVAVDPSPDMLRRAKTRSSRFVRSGRARFLQGTAESVRLRAKAGMAIATYGVIHHLPDAAALANAFRAVRRNLAPGGMFALDFFADGSMDRVWNAASVDVVEYEDIFFLKRTLSDPDTRTAYIGVTSFHRRRGGLYAKRHTTLRLKIHPLKAVAAALKRAGFSDVGFFPGRALVKTYPDKSRAVRIFTRSVSEASKESYLTVVAATDAFLRAAERVRRKKR